MKQSIEEKHFNRIVNKTILGMIESLKESELKDFYIKKVGQSLESEIEQLITRYFVEAGLEIND